MASRGYIPRLMKMAGIDMLSPEAAAPLVYEQLVNGGSTEVILSGSLGALEKSLRADGGLDIDAANRALIEGEPIHVMLSRVTGMDVQQGILLEAELSPDEPFLKDHAMNGIPLLPGVMGIEGFSIAARHVASALGASKGGFEVSHLEDIQFLAPFKFYRDEKRRITWKAQVIRGRHGLVAAVTLESTLALKARPKETILHFSGKVHLTPINEAAEERTVKPPEWNGAYTVPAEDIYKLYFHGPAFQVLEGVQRSGDIVLGKLSKDLPPITGSEETLITTPLLLELCLQTAGIWEVGSTGTLALPRSIGELDLYPIQPNGAAIYAEVHPETMDDGAMQFNARVVDSKGHLYLELHNYRTIQLPYSVEESLLKPLRELVQES
jgi:3-hydroxymyristoyl/3-hydroxydecanoyl-(acyl carrier protein) dehydratase